MPLVTIELSFTIEFIVTTFIINLIHIYILSYISIIYASASKLLHILCTVMSF